MVLEPTSATPLDDEDGSAGWSGVFSGMCAILATARGGNTQGGFTSRILRYEFSIDPSVPVSRWLLPKIACAARDQQIRAGGIPSWFRSVDGVVGQPRSTVLQANDSASTRNASGLWRCNSLEMN